MDSDLIGNLTPSLSIPRIASKPLYDAIASTYETGANSVFYSRVAEYFAPEFTRAMTGRALDLGCGTGISTDVWAARSPQLSWTGLDASNEMLNRARAKERAREVRFIHGEAEKLPFARDEFAAIGSSFALHWMKPEALESTRRVLQPGGILAVAVPLAATGAQKNGNHQLLRWIWKVRKKMSSLRSQGLNLDELEQRLSGWKIERLEEVRLIERFYSADTLWRILHSRGSWNAIVGHDAPTLEASNTNSPPEPLEFEWRLGLITARNPAHRQPS